MAAVERQPVRPSLDLMALRPQLLLLAGFLLLAIPTFIRLVQQVWTKEIGAQGPIVLATGIWLVWRRWDAMRAEAQPGPLWLTMTGVLISLPRYVFGRAYDFMILEALGLYGFGMSMLHDRFGLKAMLANWFPLFYLGFLLPA